MDFSQCHWASVFFKIPYEVGGISVVASNAPTLEAHFDAICQDDQDVPQYYTVITLPGFFTIDEARAFIAEHGLEET